MEALTPFTSADLNPIEVTAISYAPTGTAGKANRLSSLVFVVSLAPVSMLEALASARAMTARVLSTTVPLITPVDEAPSESTRETGPILLM